LRAREVKAIFSTGDAMTGTFRRLLRGLFTSLARRSAGTGGFGGITRFNHSQARRIDPQRRVTFDDVAGIGEGMDEPPEIIDLPARPDRDVSLGEQTPTARALVPATWDSQRSLALRRRRVRHSPRSFDRASRAELQSSERSTTLPSCRS
jgi:hypothetical protein